MLCFHKIGGNSPIAHNNKNNKINLWIFIFLIELKKKFVMIIKKLKEKEIFVCIATIGSTIKKKEAFTKNLVSSLKFMQRINNA